MNLAIYEPERGNSLSNSTCKQARLARDARFDGLFFTGVTTTGIYCRPVCPATPPKEKNVHYYPSALAAAQAGLRPCLRCRPESAPGSPAWKGARTSLDRALRLIDAGEWQGQSLPDFARRLGISDRYLRQLFVRHLGLSPIKYLNFRRVQFAQQLLQQTTLPVTDIAFHAGFGSVRRFNDVFVNTIGFNPGQVRRQGTMKVSANTPLTLSLAYRPPYDWMAMRDFYRMRQIEGMEQVSDNSYGRTFTFKGASGAFTAVHWPEKHCFRVSLRLDRPEYTLPVVQQIRRLLDLDADVPVIREQLARQPIFRSLLDHGMGEGLRLPGMWSAFEAGVRAVLGQQVSVKAAHNLVTQLVRELGEDVQLPPDRSALPSKLFPTPEAVAASSLAFLAIPGRRKQALRDLAKQVADTEDTTETEVELNYDHWQTINGIGPWTTQYTAFRMGNPDIFLAGDLGVKNALKKLDPSRRGCEISAEELSPWGSYATLLLWQSLSDATPCSPTNPTIKE
ncbi:MAG TPA: transcriptional regulator [Porticoccaceae bacterium]|nr:transcriptional regulator [Porticoccaceae bacterium]